MYHKITIVGNLGKDPQTRYTQDGTPVTSFSVATNRRWNKADGTQAEETVWFHVSAWRRLAEVCGEHLKKGRQVLVEGRLKPDPDTGGPRLYKKNDGSTGAQYEITALTVKFLAGDGTPASISGQAPPADVPAAPEEDESDIPF